MKPHNETSKRITSDNPGCHGVKPLRPIHFFKVMFIKLLKNLGGILRRLTQVLSS
jgi:hypothetical protein